MSTALDPRYKLDFFKETSVKEKVKKMLAEEAESMAMKLYGIPEQETMQVDADEPSSLFYSMLESFRASSESPAPMVSYYFIYFAKLELDKLDFFQTRTR